MVLAIDDCSIHDLVVVAAVGLPTESVAEMIAGMMAVTDVMTAMNMFVVLHEIAGNWCSVDDDSNVDWMVRATTTMTTTKMAMTTLYLNDAMELVSVLVAAVHGISMRWLVGNSKYAARSMRIVDLVVLQCL